MSGHSKWATIKRQKGAADIKRGQLFTKLAKAISIAVKQGGGVADPALNFKLRLAVDRARSFNMPKDSIERSIVKASTEPDTLDEVVYEGFAPSGVALVIEGVTDNKNRTVSEIKSLLEKNGGRLGNPGATSYLFNQKGVITIKKDGKTMDEILEIGLEAGAEDIEDENDVAIVYTQPSALNSVKQKFSDAGFEVEDAVVELTPASTIKVDLDTEKKITGLIEKLEENDDVQNVYTNLELS